jgi:hypothetical protein
VDIILAIWLAQTVRFPLGSAIGYELQGEAEDHAKFVVTGTAPAYLLPAMKINHFPAGFVVPAEPIKSLSPPSGPDWVHEIKHDGYHLANFFADLISPKSRMLSALLVIID